MKKVVDGSTAPGSEDGAPSEIVRGKMGRRAFLKGALATAPLLLTGPMILTPRKSHADDFNPKKFPGNMGPSTKTEPYMIPSTAGVEIISASSRLRVGYFGTF